MAGHSESDLDALIGTAASADVAGILRREAGRSRRNAAFWARLAGQTWRARVCLERAAQLELMLDLNLSGVASELAAARDAAVAGEPERFPGWQALLERVAGREVGVRPFTYNPDDARGGTS